MFGCASNPNPPPQLPQAQQEFVSQFIRESSSFSTGDCRFSLEEGFPELWKSFERYGVNETSDGVFYFTAGDSYLWADGVFVGRVGGRYELVTARRGSNAISEGDFLQLRGAAMRANTGPPRANSRNVHDSCEFVAIRDKGILTVRATRQSLARNEDGVDSLHGFEELRNLVRGLERKK